jgi:hypothetical protein
LIGCGSSVREIKDSHDRGFTAQFVGCSLFHSDPLCRVEVDAQGLWDNYDYEQLLTEFPLFFERNSRSSAFQLRKEKEGLCTKHIDENTALTAITGDKRKTETALLKH